MSLGSASSNTGELFGNNIGVPLGNRPAYPGKRPPYKPDVPCHTQKLPDLNGPASAKSAPTGAPATSAQVKSERDKLRARGRPGGRAGQAQPVRREARAGDGEGQVRTAIRKHLPDFLAIIALLIIAMAVASVILGKQRLALPAWVPLVGKDFFVIEAEMSTAQAVTPGQGQTVNIAGVEVGEIASVKLRDGKAIIGMKIQPKYSRIYKDASVLLRPKTGLKDMVAELTPGTQGAGRLEEGAVIPVSQTLPDVNLDEILASLDTDTRDFLVLLLNDGAEGLGSERKGRELAQAIRRLEPTAKYSREINEGLAERRRNLARVVHNFSLLTNELGRRDTQLANFVQNSNAVFETLRRRGRVAAGDPAEAAGNAGDDADDAGEGRHARADDGPDARGAAPGGPRARPVAAPDTAVPARVDADHPGRDPAVHARRAADGEGAAPGDARPRRGDA